jgi:hypothetical protein
LDPEFLAAWEIALGKLAWLDPPNCEAQHTPKPDGITQKNTIHFSARHAATAAGSGSHPWLP